MAVSLTLDSLLLAIWAGEPSQSSFGSVQAESAPDSYSEEYVSIPTSRQGAYGDGGRSVLAAVTVLGVVSFLILGSSISTASGPDSMIDAVPVWSVARALDYPNVSTGQ